MSDEREMTGFHDRGDDAAAYVLGALEPAEAEEFRRHLASCTACREQVAALQQTANALPMAAPQYPVPARLRRRVLRTVRAERERPPRSAAPMVGRLAVPRPIAAGAALAAAMAAIVLALSLSGAGGARVIKAQVAGISGAAQFRLSGDHGELVVHHLSPPPRGRIYEVWTRRSGHAPVPANVLFGATPTGSSYVPLPGSMRGVSLVMVTPEPAGGSRVPTHSAVITARLS